MNPFFNLLLLFLFIISIFYFIINISDQTFIKDKLIIFVAIFLFQMILMIISKIINGCKINIHDMINECLRIALISVIGYSVYTDLTIMDNTKKAFEYNPIYPDKNKWIVSIVIIIFIALVKTIQLLIGAEQYSCS